MTVIRYMNRPLTTYLLVIATLLILFCIDQTTAPSSAKLLSVVLIYVVINLYAYYLILYKDSYMYATFTVGDPNEFGHGYHKIRVRYSDRKDLHKKLRMYCEDEYETKGRELVMINDTIPDSLIFKFYGREPITFTKTKDY